MLYVWSYLKKYPKWLALNLFSAVLFVIVNWSFANDSAHD